jgi:hypothetical protein
MVCTMDPVSAGLTVLRMLGTGVTHLWRLRYAPWSAAPFLATMKQHEGTWHSIRLRCANDKPFEINVLSVRTVRPKKGLPLRPNDGTPQQGMVVTTPENSLDLHWTVAEKGATFFRYDCVVFFDLKGRHGDVSVELELKLELLDNRRTKTNVWVRTNPVKLN